MIRALAIGFLVLVGAGVCRSVSADDPELSLPELVQRFVAEFGRIEAIAISEHPDSSYAVALCDELNLVSVTFGKGNSWRRVSVDVAYPTPVHLKFADLDGDGISELLVGSKQLEIYRIGDQKLSLVWESEKMFGDDPAPVVEVADLDRDSVNEIVVLNYLHKDEQASSVYVWKQTGTDAFGYKIASDIKLTDRHEYHSTSGLAIDDFTGDGTSQLAVANDSGILWILSMKSGKLAIIGESEIPEGGAIGPGLKAANMDRDEAKELLVGSNGGQIYVCNLDKGANVKWSDPFTTGRLAYGVNSSDFDGDGIDEFVLSRGNIGYDGMTEKDVVVQVLQFKDGKFQEKWQHKTVDLPRVLVHDLNGDGSDSIITYSAVGSGDEVQVFRPQLSPQK